MSKMLATTHSLRSTVSLSQTTILNCLGQLRIHSNSLDGKESDESALISAHDQCDDEESLEPNSVQDHQAALDADYALALSLQAQLNDMTVSHRRTSYRSEPNEKGKLLPIS